MSKATKDRIVRLKIREVFLEMKWVTTDVSIPWLLKQIKRTIQFVVINEAIWVAMKVSLNISSGCKGRAEFNVIYVHTEPEHHLL